MCCGAAERMPPSVGVTESDEQCDSGKAGVNRDRHCAGSSLRVTLLDSERRVIAVVDKDRRSFPFGL